MDTPNDKPPELNPNARPAPTEPEGNVKAPAPRRYSGSHAIRGSARTKFLLDAKGPAARHRAKARIVRELIDPARLADEPSLQANCFFPYQYLGPYERTQLFAHYLNYAKQIHATKRGIHLQGNRARPIERETEATFSALWAARQEFDRRGLDYQKATMWIVERAFGAGHKFLPRPNQLFSPEAMDEAMNMWLEHGWWEISFFDAIEPVEPDEVDDDGADDEWASVEIPDDPTPPLDTRFCAANFVGSPQQVRALDALEVYVMKGQAGLPKHRLATLLHRAKLITEAEAVRRFGQELVDEAVQAPGYVVEPPEGPIRPHVPGCFGFGPVAANPVCASCPASENCGKLTALVDADLMSAYGSTDPRSVRKKEANRRHQAASRARKKARSRRDDETKT